MLRIHFSGADLARVRLAAEPDPLWELCLSIHQLRGRRYEATLGDWRQAVSSALRPGAAARSEVDVLLRLNPPTGYFPDFLTPEAGQAGFDSGVQSILRTPIARMRRDLERLAAARADARVDLQSATDLAALERALDRYRQIALDPVWDRVRGAVEADLAQRRQLLANSGVEGLLAGLGPAVRWTGSVMEIADYRVNRDVHLDGRGITLIPSYFKTAGRPIGLADPDLPPVLVYPVERVAGAAGRPGALAELIGRTRANVLAGAAHGATTGEIARRLGISAASASQHLSVLREAGLVLSVRDGNRVRHLPTTLGSTFLHN